MSDPEPRHPTPEPTPAHKVDAESTDTAARRIAEALRGIRYGSVLAVVQDGKLVQIDRTEKIRYVR